MAGGKRGLAAVGLIAVLLVVFGVGWLTGRMGLGAATDPASLPDVERQFVESMRGAALVGHFTLDGREDRAAEPDRYDIYSVDKVGEDQWRFNTKIGEIGITLPVVVTMRFVDDTPLILLTDTTIPPLGTFSARVFFHDDRYAGTWQHGDRGGHLYGRIERGAAQ
jgi:hypothetical protein